MKFESKVLADFVSEIDEAIYLFCQCTEAAANSLHGLRLWAAIVKLFLSFRQLSKVTFHSVGE